MSQSHFNGNLDSESKKICHSFENAKDNISLRFQDPNSNLIEKRLKKNSIKSHTKSLPTSTFEPAVSLEGKGNDSHSVVKKLSFRKEFSTCKLKRTSSEPSIPVSKSSYNINGTSVVSPFFARYRSQFEGSTEATSSTSSFDSISLTDSDSTRTSSRPPLSASQLSLPEPPDGGWGWVVVVAAFFVHMITDGVIVSFGVLIEALIEEFQDSMGAISWIGSFSYGIPALAAPLSSLLLNRFGCRITCILGGLISGVGCLAGVFTKSIISLVFLFGILSGLGASLCITSALVIVSIYFDDRRATATGLSIAGTGVGALVFAPMVDILLNKYTWRGALMILSGCFLNMMVCGALMRPVETEVEKRHRQRLAWLEHLARESGLPPPIESADYLDRDVLGRIKMLRDHLLAPRRVTLSYLHKNSYPNNQENTQLGIFPYGDIIHKKVETEKNANPTRKRILNEHGVSDDGVSKSPLLQSNLMSIPEELSVHPDAENKYVVDHKVGKSSDCIHFISTEVSKDVVLKNVSQTSVPDTKGVIDNVAVPQTNNTISSNDKPVSSVITKDISKDVELQHAILESDFPAKVEKSVVPIAKEIFPPDLYENVEVLHRGSLVNTNNLRKPEHESSLSLPELHQLRRANRSISSDESGSSFYQSSVFFEAGCCGHIRKSDTESLSEDESRLKKSNLACCFNFCAETVFRRCDLQRLIDLRLFRRPSFVFFMISNFLLYFWYNVTYFFMGVRAIDYGLSETFAALLFSVLGGANMVGEILVGLLADREWVDALVLYLLMILACGISTCLMPLFTTFPSMAMYASVFGMGLAANDALCTVLLVDFVGLPRLTNGLGICFFCQGVANILGPPTIGYIMDLTQSHGPAYVISGFGMVLAGLAVLPIILQRFRRKRARRLRRAQQEAKEKPSLSQMSELSCKINGDIKTNQIGV